MKISEKALAKLKEKYERMSAFDNKYRKHEDYLIAGIDEAGRGPLAGPVVAAACILDPSNPIYGLDDSKKLSEKKREALFDEITEKAICFHVSMIENDIIDDINILNATKIAMVECVDKISKKPDVVLIDAIKLEDTGVEVIPIIKGDTLSLSIAAASILAKVTRDRLMIEYSLKYPGYGFEKNKGYGTKQHYEGISKNGITPIHRKTFLKGLECFK